MHVGTLNGNRRYEFDSKLDYHQFNTTKRKPNLPITFGNYKSQAWSQRFIAKTGCPTVCHAIKKRQGNSDSQLSVYQSGTGKVTMITIMNKAHAATN